MIVEDGGGTLSVVLAGHPKLKNDLRRPTMEEIGYRATVFSLEGIVGSQREYIEWLVSRCTIEGTQISEILSAEAPIATCHALENTITNRATFDTRGARLHTFLGKNLLPQRSLSPFYLSKLTI
ncbi:MAG: hypothetical protein PUP93_20845 [Rhizonema sp. NSF051]|nr:hypothetical protein [Rhizonema sp. NSF051]